MARPRKRISPELVQSLAEAQLTVVEIARICKVSVDTIDRRFAERIKTWRGLGTGSVRHELYKTAMGASKGKVGAMIFFLKNYGGLSDHSTITGPNGGPVQIQSLAHLTDEQLAQAEAIVESAFARTDQG